MALAYDHELLTAEQERELGRRWREHGDRRAIERLVECNVRLAKSYAGRWLRTGKPLEELEHYALIGIWKAAEKFEPEKGFRFTTYAHHWMRHYVERCIGDDETIFLPVHARGWRPQVYMAQKAIRERGEDPTPEAITREIAAYRDDGQAPSARVIEAILQHVEPLSLDAKLPGHSHKSDSDGVTLAELLPAPDDREEREDEAEKHARARSALERLNPLDRLVLERRYIDGQTLEETGEELDVTRERCRQIEVRALVSVRAADAANTVADDYFGMPPASDPCWPSFAAELEEQLPATLAKLKQWAAKNWRGGEYPPGAKLRQVLAWMLLERRVRKGAQRYELVPVEARELLDKPMLDTHEAAAVLAVKPNSMLKLVERGQVESVKENGRRLFPSKALLHRDRCLCARTAPHVNYGCPLHGKAFPRLEKPQQETTMDMINAKEAGKILGISPGGVQYLARRGRFKFTKEGNGPRAPLMFERATIETYAATRKGDGSEEAKPAKKTIAAKTVKRAPKPEPHAPSGADIRKVALLVECVEAEILTQQEAWDRIVEVVGLG